MTKNRRETILLLVLLSSLLLTMLPTILMTPVVSATTIGDRQLGADTTLSGELSSTNTGDYFSLALSPGYYNITVSPSGTLRPRMAISWWVRQVGGPSRVAVDSEFVYPASTVSAGAPGAKIWIALTVIPPYYNYTIFVDRLAATSGKYNITASTISSFQPIASLPGTFSGNISQNRNALCKFDVTDGSIYNFTLGWGSSSNNLAARAYVTGKTEQLTMDRGAAVVNAFTTLGLFMPSRTYPFPCYVVVRGVTVAAPGESFTFNVSKVTPHITLSMDGSLTTGNISTGQSFYYTAPLQLGYYYNLTLAPATGVDVNLYIHSPQTRNFGVNTKGTFESTLGGAGVNESITDLVMFDGYGYGKVGTVFQDATTFPAYPISPSRVIVEVECTTGPGVFNITGTRKAFEAFAVGTVPNFVLNASANQHRYFAVSESVGSIYSWNTTLRIKTSGMGLLTGAAIVVNLFEPVPEGGPLGGYAAAQLEGLHIAVMSLAGIVPMGEIVDAAWQQYAPLSLRYTNSFVAATNVSLTNDQVCLRDGVRYVGFATYTAVLGLFPVHDDNSNFTIAFYANVTAPTPLPQSALVGGKLALNAYGVYSIDLSAGHTYRVSLLSGSITPVMTLIDQYGMIASDGKTLSGSPYNIVEPQAENDYSVLVVPARSGAHYVIIYPSAGEGNYYIRLIDLTPTPFFAEAIIYVASIIVAAVGMGLLGFYIGTRKRRGK